MTVITPQTQGYKAIISIGGKFYPCYDNPSFRVPKNWQTPSIIGNYATVNVDEGVQVPIMEFNLAVRDKSSSNNATQPSVLSSTFLNLFLARSNDVAHDVATISGGITFWNGRSGFVMTGAKADSFTTGTSKGDAIRFSARFMASDFTAIDPGSPPTAPDWDNTRLLSFKAINFASPLTDIVQSFNASYSNNLQTDGGLNGKYTVSQVNAAGQSGGFQMTVKAADLTLPADEDPVSWTVTGRNGDTCVFQFNSTLDNIPNDHTIAMPFSMREHQYICKATHGQGSILSVTSTF